LLHSFFDVVNPLVCLFRRRFNVGQARYELRIRLSLFLLLRLDFVRVRLDVSDLGLNGRVVLHIAFLVLVPVTNKSDIAEHDSAYGRKDGKNRCKSVHR
jgi:hypothetical protein